MAHAAGGIVCLTPTVDSAGAATSSCPSSFLVLAGPVTSPPSQLRVAVFVQGSDPLNGFDVTLSTNPSILQPADADLTGTILLGSITVLGKCIQGLAVQGGCGPASTANVTTLELAAAGGGGLTVQPTSGLLFTAIFNIVGDGTITISFAHNGSCTPSSGTGADSLACISISNGTGIPPSELLQAAGFDDTTLLSFATYDTPSFTSLTTLAPISGSTAHVFTGQLTSRNNFVGNCQSPPSTFDTCAVSFSSRVSGPSVGITVTNPVAFSLSGLTGCGGAGCVDNSPMTQDIFTIVAAATTTTGTYTLVFTATYETENTVTNVVSTISQSMTATVVIQDFTFTVSPTTVPLWTGTTGTGTATVSPVNGFSTTVSLSSVPFRGIVGFSPTSITGGSGNSTLFFSSGTVGAYTVSIRGTASLGGQTKTRSVVVTVREQDFNITSNTSTVTFLSGSTGTATIAIGSLPSSSLAPSGFSGNITLTTSVTPSSPVLRVSFSQNPVTVTAGQSSTSTITFSGTVSANTVYTVVINGTGTNGSSSRSHAVTITVSVNYFSIVAGAVNPSQISAGSNGISMIVVTGSGGLTGTVNLSVSASTPAGLTCTLPPNVTFGSSPQTATLSCSAAAAADYIVAVTGIMGDTSFTSSPILFHVIGFAVTASPVSPSEVQLAPSGTTTTTRAVCVVPLIDGATGGSTASCAFSTITFNGTVTSPPMQLRVAIFIQGSDPLNGFDITLSTNPNILQPIDTDLTGTVLLGSTIVLAKCIQGTVITGVCGPGAANNITTTELAVVGNGGLTPASTTGLLFTAIYNIVGTGSTMINFAHSSACNPSSSGTACVLISNGTFTPDSETLQAAAIVAPSQILVGTSGFSTITVTALNGFAGMVSLAVSSPFGLSCTGPSTSSVTVPPTQTLTLTCNAASAGDYIVVVNGTSGSITNTVTVLWHVTDFSVTASPTSLNMLPGFNVTSTVTVASINGFTGTVTCTASVSPAGPTVGLNPADLSVPLGGSVTSTLTTSSAIAGTYTVIVSCTDPITHSATVTVTSTPEPTFVDGRLSWTHHLNLGQSLGLETFTAMSENTGPSIVYAQVVVFGYADSLSFSDASPVFTLSPGVVTSTTFTVPLSSSVVGLKIHFTTVLLYSTNIDNNGNPVTAVTSSVTKSGCFAVVP